MGTTVSNDRLDKPDPSIPLTADDYPLANATTSFNLTNYPDGNYRFSLTGSATVAFTDIGQLAGPVTVSNGVTTGTVIVNHQTGDGNVWTWKSATSTPPSRWTTSTR